MNRCAIVIMSLALLGVAGCALPPRQVGIGGALPERGVNYRAETSQSALGDPWALSDRFEADYRDNALNFSKMSRGLDVLRYPTTTHPNASWMYIQIGEQFAAEQHWSAAARAYWAALGLSSRMRSSRADRERLRAAAFEGLAGLAKQRGQTRWSELLSLCADLARTYLNSPQSQEQEDAFFLQLAKLREAEQRAERAAARARHAQEMRAVSLAMQSQFNSLNAQMGVQDLQTTNQNNQALLRDSMQLRSDRAELAQALAAAHEELGEGAGKLADISASDLSEIEAGKAFVGQQVLLYLAAASQKRAYLAVLQKFAADKPDLAAVIEDFINEPNARSTLRQIGEEVQHWEVYVATFERRGALPGPKFLANACASERTTECLAASRQLCLDEQITPACVELAGLYAQGRGVDADPTRAEELFAQACAAGEYTACERREQVHQDLVDSRRRHALVARVRGRCKQQEDFWACELVETAPASGKPQANGAWSAWEGCASKNGAQCRRLAQMYMAGQAGLKVNELRAVKAFGIGCDIGDALSCMSAADAYRSGYPGIPSVSLADSFQRKACKLGLKQACRPGDQPGAHPEETGP